MERIDLGVALFFFVITCLFFLPTTAFLDAVEYGVLVSLCVTLLFWVTRVTLRWIIQAFKS